MAAVGRVCARQLASANGDRSLPSAGAEGRRGASAERAADFSDRLLQTACRDDSFELCRRKNGRFFAIVFLWHRNAVVGAAVSAPNAAGVALDVRREVFVGRKDGVHGVEHLVFEPAPEIECRGGDMAGTDVDRLAGPEILFVVLDFEVLERPVDGQRHRTAVVEHRVVDHAHQCRGVGAGIRRAALGEVGVLGRRIVEEGLQREERVADRFGAQFPQGDRFGDGRDGRAGSSPIVDRERIGAACAAVQACRSVDEAGRIVAVVVARKDFALPVVGGDGHLRIADDGRFERLFGNDIQKRKVLGEHHLGRPAGFDSPFDYQLTMVFRIGRDLAQAAAQQRKQQDDGSFHGAFRI